MNFFSTLVQQLALVFNSQNAARRFLFLLILGSSLAGLGYIATQARTGAFQPLMSDVTLTDAASISAKLTQLDIPVRFSDGGKTLQVPTRDFNRALILLSQDGFPASGTIGWELMDKSSIGLSQEEQTIRFHRAQEGELARTIKAIDVIENARVHLAIPKSSLFVRDKSKPTASVIVKVRGGRGLSEKEVAGISRLVAFAVQEMEPSDVSIVDSRGNLLNQGIDANSESVTLGSRMSYKIAYETGLKNRIEEMLSKTLGDGKVVASVNAEFDFAQRTVTEQIFDPNGEGGVVRSENYFGEGAASSGPGAGGAGAAGSSSNLPPGSPGSPTGSLGGAQRNSKIDRSTIFEISTKTKQVVETVPLLQRITASVFVDGIYEEVPGADGETIREFRPLPERDKLILEGAVKNIIGFTADRGNGTGDAVSVNSMPIRDNQLEIVEIPLMERLVNPNLIREVIQWAVVSVVAFLLIFLVLRPAAKSVMVIPSGTPLNAALPRPAAQAGGYAAAEAAPSPAGLPGAEPASPGLPSPANLNAMDPAQMAALRQSGENEAALAEAAQSNIPKASSIVRSWLDES